jgi:hypothetical protein
MRAQSLKTAQRRRDEAEAARQERRDAANRRIAGYRVEDRQIMLAPANGVVRVVPAEFLNIPKVKVASFVSQSLRDNARGILCMFESPWCNRNPETTVLIHSDSLEDGNGQGCKPNDLIGAAPGCSDCHRWFGECKQGTGEERRAMFLRANRRWLTYLTANDLLVVKRRKT